MERERGEERAGWLLGEERKKERGRENRDRRGSCWVDPPRERAVSKGPIRELYRGES